MQKLKRVFIEQFDTLSHSEHTCVITAPVRKQNFIILAAVLKVAYTTTLLSLFPFEGNYYSEL